MRPVCTHIVVYTIIALIVAFLNSYFVQHADGHEASQFDRMRCLFNIDVRQCYKYLARVGSKQDLIKYGCCAIVKTKCSPEVACLFTEHCANIKDCKRGGQREHYELVNGGNNHGGARHRR